MMLNEIVYIIAMLSFFAGSIWLQIFLSRGKNKWLGLVIPFVCFMFSIIIIFSLAIYTDTGTISITEIVDGVKVIDKTVTSPSERPGIISMLATVTPVFLISNIPTVIFLAIYFACREKIKLYTELDKMNIQDLD